MRAPPLSVCSGRFSASRPSTLLRFSFHCASALCEASMSSTASSVKMLAMSWIEIREHVFDDVGRAGAGAGRRGANRRLSAGKEAGGAATAGATGAGGVGSAGCMAVSSAARAAATMRCSSCSVACSMRASSAPCDWKNPVDSSRCAATACMAFMQSPSRSRSADFEADAAVEGLAHPVFERRGETDAMARLGHARAAGQRVAGAIGLFAHDVRRGLRALDVHVAQHRGDVDLRFAAVDVAQLHVGARILPRARTARCSSPRLPASSATSLRRPSMDDSVDRTSRNLAAARRTLRRRGCAAAARCKRGHAAGRGDDVVAPRVERALENFHGRGLRARGTAWLAASACARSTMSCAFDGARLLGFERVDQLAGDARRRRARVARIDGERCSVFSMILLSRFSMAQANSAMSVAPTMRPEPLSVWNARRTPMSASVSSGFCSQAGNSLRDRGDLFARLLYI